MSTDRIGVSCRGIRKHFGHGNARVDALRGVDFETRVGELSFLVGPSGCGKTTLISIVAGLLDPSAGEITVLGTRPEDLSANERVLFRRQNLGFIFQQFNLLPALTAAENVHAGLGTALDVERAAGLLAATTSRQPDLERVARRGIFRLGVLLGRNVTELLTGLQRPRRFRRGQRSPWHCRRSCYLGDPI